MKSKFGSHTETYKDGWVPNVTEKTINNRSSVPYDIINMDNNPIFGAIQAKMADKKLFNMKKGVSEISDLKRVTNPNYDPNYNKLYGENKRIFKSLKGIFTQMYDASHRNGGISLPFRRGAGPDNNDDGQAKAIKSSGRRQHRKNHHSIDFGSIPSTTRRMHNKIQLDVSPTTNINVMPATTTNVIQND